MVEVTGTRIIWSGGLNSTAVVLRIEADPSEAIALFEGENAQAPTISTLIQSGNIKVSKESLKKYGVNHALVELNFSNLRPDTEYLIRLGMASASQVLGKFKTFPLEGSPYNFSFGAASCVKWQSSGSKTYSDIISKSPRFFISTGDLFYGDINSNNLGLFIDQYLTVLKEPIQKSFFAQISTFYIFDDHDFSNNDSNGVSLAKNASLTAFDSFYPHYPLLQTPDNTIIGFQAFTVGRTRFVITDLRSEATGPMNNPTLKTTLGLFQRERLLQELSGFRNFQLMVWVSSKPWSAANNTGSEDWSDYADERALIANHISITGVNNLVMIAGDAHMLAADDGSNTDFSTIASGSGAGFPLFHSAPMAQYGSVKGGAYSVGCHGYLYYPNYQYSIFTVTDYGSSICIKFDGIVVPSNTVLTYTACRETTNTSSFVKRSASNTNSSLAVQKCRLPWFPPFLWVVIALLIFLVLVGIALFIFRKKIRCLYKPSPVDLDSSQPSSKLDASSNMELLPKLPAEETLVSEITVSK